MFLPKELLSIKNPKTLFIYVCIPSHMINPICAIPLPSL